MYMAMWFAPGVINARGEDAWQGRGSRSDGPGRHKHVSAGCVVARENCSFLRTQLACLVLNSLT